MTNRRANHGWVPTAVVAILLPTIVSIRAQAQTYDCVKDFSIASNPTGVWSYGWTPTLGGAFTLYTVTDTTSVPGMSAWLDSGTYPSDPPYVDHNDTTGTICFETFCVPPRYLHLHPGANGQYTVVRWTAPSAGTYEIRGSFVGLDGAGPTTTDVHVLVNSEFPLFSGNIASYGSPLPFLRKVPIRSAGVTIDFAVGYGSDKSNGFDSTGSNCRITQTSTQ